MTQKPIFFWNPHPPTPYTFLSPHYPSPFHSPDNPHILYKTEEHWMMHAKCVLFAPDDHLLAQRILHATTPAEAKALGRSVPGYDSAAWMQHREGVVAEGNYLKFTQARARAPRGGGEPMEGTPLGELLLLTGERELVEASPEDGVWGIGYSAEDAEGVERREWGMNLCGKVLMRVRERLRREDKDKGS